MKVPPQRALNKKGLVFIKIIQRNRASRLLTYLLVCDEALTHIIRKTEKFHAVSSTNYKPRKTSISMKSQLSHLRACVAGGANPSLRGKEHH